MTKLQARFKGEIYQVENIIPDIKCQYALIKRDSAELMIPLIQLEKFEVINDE